ncbi:MAG TPA: hypothetical protein VNT52_06090 [Acidimicrobiales bacterium]|nr:hypothetical protein [Acidimicrobiales bacterium]
MTATWGRSLPAGETAPPVRGREAVLAFDDAGAGLSWLERADLLVTVSTTNVGVDDLRRIAEGLREQSHAEVLRRPTGQQLVVGRGELAGTPFELRVRAGTSGRCLMLLRGWEARVCAGDPFRTVADLPASGAVFQGGVVFGAVVPRARTVRLELAGGRSVETEALGADTGQDAAFYVAALAPDDARVEAVVAIGAGGEVLRRTPAG